MKFKVIEKECPGRRAPFNPEGKNLILPFVVTDDGFEFGPVLTAESTAKLFNKIWDHDLTPDDSIKL